MLIIKRTISQFLVKVRHKYQMILQYQQKVNILLVLQNQEKRFVFSLHCNGSNRFLYGDATIIYQFKTKDSKIKPYPWCLSNISKDITINNMKKTGLRGAIELFLFDYNAIDTNNILDIHRYLMKET